MAETLTKTKNNTAHSLLPPKPRRAFVGPQLYQARQLEVSINQMWGVEMKKKVVLILSLFVFATPFACKPSWLTSALKLSYGRMNLLSSAPEIHQTSYETRWIHCERRKHDI